MRWEGQEASRTWWKTDCAKELWVWVNVCFKGWLAFSSDSNQVSQGGQGDYLGRGCYKSLIWILEAESTYLFWSVEFVMNQVLTFWYIPIHSDTFCIPRSFPKTWIVLVELSLVELFFELSWSGELRRFYCISQRRISSRDRTNREHTWT